MPYLFIYFKLFFPTNISIHLSSRGGQSLLVVADGGLALAIGQGWAAPNCACALPRILVALVSYNASCRRVKPHGIMLGDSEGVKGARPDVFYSLLQVRMKSGGYCMRFPLTSEAGCTNTSAELEDG